MIITSCIPYLLFSSSSLLYILPFCPVFICSLVPRPPTQTLSCSSGEFSPRLRDKVWAGGLGTRLLHLLLVFILVLSSLFTLLESSSSLLPDLGLCHFPFFVLSSLSSTDLINLLDRLVISSSQDLELQLQDTILQSESSESDLLTQLQVRAVFRIAGKLIWRFGGLVWRIVKN